MKYLNKLFAFDDRQSHHQTSATLTSTIYQVTFVPRSSSATNQTSRGESSAPFDRHSLTSSASPSPSSSLSSSPALSRNRVTILAHGEPLRRSSSATNLSEDGHELLIEVNGDDDDNDEEEEEARRSGSLGDYLLSATIDKTIASTSTITPIDRCNQRQEQQPHRHQNHSQRQQHPNHHHHQLIVKEDGDWILVEEELKTSGSGSLIKQAQIDHHHHKLQQQQQQLTSKRRHAHSALSYGTSILIKTTRQQMALDQTDVELIKTSWIPVRKDPVAHGVLLFKGLFTKFPQYLSFFPQFSDLDVENMHENKRLLRHASRVIETVTFVVDAIGDESKTSQLNEALVGLVKSHIKRRIGLAEFRNLGIVLIDFICDVNQRKGNHQMNGGTTQTKLVAAWTKLYSGILDLVKREEEQQQVGE